MKLPRDVSAARLIRALEQAGYEVIRQKGSTSGYGIRDHPNIHSPCHCTAVSRPAHFTEFSQKSR